MTIWSAEIKDLEKLYSSFKGQYPKLDNELQRLIKTDDENIVLVYARRCLEVIITDMSERELKRPRGTEPLKGIIDKLNREEKVPDNIIVSMQNLNSLSTFGAHPKDFEPRQVKPVLLDLITVLEWYLKYMEAQGPLEGKEGSLEGEKKGTAGTIKTRSKPGKRTIMVTSILLVAAIIIVSLIVFNVAGVGKQARAGSIESIVILPFGNYTGVDTLDPFISTMHSLLINEIGKIPGLRIIGRVSSDLYKNADKSIQQIAKELKVDAAIELDVLCLGDTICMQPRLMSGGTEEKQLWIGDYREAKGNLFNLYNRIIRQIASEVKVSLTPAQEAMMAESRTIDPDAIDAYLKGLYYWDQFSPETLELALEYFNKAIEIDPDWALPYAGVSYYWGAIAITGLAPDSITRPRIYENLEKAFKLDPKSDFILYRRAAASVWSEFNWKKGEQEFLQVLEINPSHAFARVYYGHLLACLKRDSEAQEQGEIAVMLDPLNPMIQSMYALLLALTGEFDKGIEFAEKALAVAPGNVGALNALKYCYFGKGECRKAFDTWMRLTPLDENTRSAILATCDQDGYVFAAEKLAEEWENAGCLVPTDIVEAYIIAKNYSKAMDWLEKAYENHDHNIPYFGLTMFQKEPYKIDDPRFHEFLKKLNLPLPKAD